LDDRSSDLQESRAANDTTVALTNYIEVARFAGLDPYEMLRGARINPDQLIDPECRIPARARADVVDSARLSAARTSGC